MSAVLPIWTPTFLLPKSLTWNTWFSRGLSLAQAVKATAMAAKSENSFRIIGRAVVECGCPNIDVLQLPFVLRKKICYIPKVISHGGDLVSTGSLKRELRAEGLAGLVKKPENNKC